MDSNFGEKVFENFLSVYIIPEIEHRKKIEKISEDFALEKAQIIFYPDDHPHVILLNEELKGIEASVKLKNGIEKKQGNPIYEHEIEGIHNIILDKKLYPNCAHATFIKLNNIWYVIFNFTYNRDLAQKHIDIAEQQFWPLAKLAYKHELWNAFVDNLFSAAELSIKAFFLLFPDKVFHKNTHKGLSLSYNRFAYLGNVKETHKDTFNKLAGRRTQARYLSGGELKITVKEARNYLKIVQDMIEDCKERINT